MRRLLMTKLGYVAVACLLTAMVAVPVGLADSSASRIKDCPAGDWCTYHRSHLGWRHSPLDQINTGNVGQLRPAWMFQPGRVPMGLISTPLAIGGMIYLPVNPSTVWKLDGATGERIWVYVPEMDDAIISRTFFAHTRGVTIGDGRVYMGQADGRIVALDEQTGEVMWDRQIVDSKRDTAGFSGGGSFVNSDLLVIGQNGGEYPVEGRIFGLDPKTGDVKWTFYTTGRGDPHALATWGGDTWKYGGGSWQAGSVDYENNQIFFGTGNPNPDFDYCGADCLDVNADAYRPGANLYTSSTVALDLDTGKLNWYFQEAPSDPYDYDSSPGEYVLFENNGQQLVLHVGKNGFYHVHDRKSGKPINVYANAKAINWTTGFNLETGEWENMLWPEAGEKTLVCPHIEGGHSWNAGAYNPDTGLFYRVAQEWCMWLTIARAGGQDEVTIGAATRITEPFAQPFMSATWGVARPPSPDDPTQEGTENYHAFITARDPLTGETAWERRYDIVPHSALLSTGGGLIFNGTYEGYAEALDARNGDVLWRFNTGSGHNGGIISYEAGGKQYVAVPSGHGSYVGGGIAAAFADKLLHYEQSATLVTFELP